VSDRLLDADAVAQRLGVPRSWVLESARSGAMPCVRLGRYVRFDLADVEAWLESMQAARTADRVEVAGLRPSRSRSTLRLCGLAPYTFRARQNALRLRAAGQSSLGGVCAERRPIVATVIEGGRDDA
jgi:excisionase family DNA binding protein